MNIFDEFHKVVRRFQAEEIAYALVGGVAVAFHAEPRFTRDVDILIREADLERVAEVLKQEGYFRSSSPLALEDSHLILHRFLRVEGPSAMVLDVLVAGDRRHEQIIERALEVESETMGVVKVADKADLIWLKRRMNSKQDQADIPRLSDEES